MDRRIKARNKASLVGLNILNFLRHCKHYELKDIDLQGLELFWERPWKNKYHSHFNQLHLKSTELFTDR
jgi:hypothetical protein